MPSTVITINGKEYKFRLCLGSRFVFEKLCPEPLDLYKIQHQCLLFYAMLVYGDKDFNFELSFDEFIDWLDDENHFNECASALVQQMEAKAIFNKQSGDTGEDKKKV